MMEATENDGNHDVRWKTGVFQLEANDIRTSQKPMMQADQVLKSLSPLINCMRPFGLYFTRKPRVGCETSLQQRAGRCQDWNFARIYATVILVVAWLNAVRFVAVFDGTETFGAALFMKLGMIPGALMNIVLHTAYYIASHTGALDRVLRQANLSAAKLFQKYDRRTKVVVVVSCTVLSWSFVHYIYQLFSSGRNNDLFLIDILLNKTLSESWLYVIKAVFVVLQLQTLGTWLFPQAMKSTCLHYLSLLCPFVSSAYTSSNELHGDGCLMRSVRASGQ